MARLSIAKLLLAGQPNILPGSSRIPMIKRLRAGIAKASSGLLYACASRVAFEIESGHLQLSPVLAEYPKSGGSLLFFVLTQLVRRSNIYCEELPHIYSSKRFNLDIDQSSSPIARASVMAMRPHAPFSPLKTHSSFDQRYRSVICLFREPLGLMKSYFRFLKMHGFDEYPSFADLLFCRRNGLPGWLSFHESYLEAPLDRLIYFCEYHPLIMDPCLQLNRLLRGVYGLMLNESGERFVNDAFRFDYGRDLENDVCAADPRRCSAHRFIGSRWPIPGDLEVLPAELEEQCIGMLNRLRGAR